MAALLIWACSGSLLAAPAKIIFDTDMAEDVDDVGAWLCSMPWPMREKPRFWAA